MVTDQDGGGAAIGRQAAVNVVDRAGSAMIIGCSKAGAHDTVAYPTGRRGHGRRGAADLIDAAISGVCPNPLDSANRAGLQI